MMKSHLLLLLLSLQAFTALSQCLVALPPPACTGSEPSLANNETIATGTTKWYYGPTATLNNLSLQGGTIVICSDLTIDHFSMTSGTIYVRPGARFVIGSGSGAGLTLNGNCTIYNYGTMDVQRNLSMDAGATAASPNIIINAIPGAIFRVPFQYFVINNQYSWFVNNGTAEFGGLITDQNAIQNSVCLGNGSITRMNVLINKPANAYKVDWGNACVYVAQTSIFNNRLTTNNNLYACLSSGHNSYSGCGGCPANNWGSANVITGCSSCMALGVLDAAFIDLHVTTVSSGNELSWSLSGSPAKGTFSIERSADALHYTPIRTIDVAANVSTTTTFHHTDKSPLPGYNYYMIKFINNDKAGVNSKAVRVSSVPPQSLLISPMPFQQQFTITFPIDTHPEKIIVTDITGRNIAIRYSIHAVSNKAEVELLEDVADGMYILHVKAGNTTMARTILKY